jgi:hypothetical protein
MPGPERWFSVALGIWLFGIFAYFVPAATWNPVSHFDLTRAIVEHRKLSIDVYADNTGDRAFAGGHWYTEKAPVPSFLAVPAYAVLHATQRARGQVPDYAVVSTARVPARRVFVNNPFQQGLYVCALSTAGVGTALLGVILFHLMRRRFEAGASLFGSSSVILGTPLLSYGTSFYGHGVAAALLVVAFAALFLEPGGAPSRSRVRIASAALALATGTEYLAAVPGLVLVVAFLVTSSPKDARARLWDLFLGAVAPALLIAGYHQACFGAPWRTGYGFLVRPEFAAGHAEGLMGLHLPTLEGLSGLLVGERRGLFFLAPFSALALAFGVCHAVRSRDLASRVGIFAFVALLLVNGGYYMWWGGASAGPRHLVPVLPFLAFGAAAAWQSRARALVLALAAVSVMNVLVLTAVGLEAPDSGNLLFDYAYPRFMQGDVALLSGASNLGIRLGLARGATLGPILVWILLGMRFFARQLADRANAEPTPAALVSFPSGAQLPPR